jgi:exportin-5
LERDSVELNLAGLWWHDIIQNILPNLLQFITHAHAFHNPAYWTGLPENMHPLVERVLTDRFWQAGISTGTKDDFYTRVTTTKHTMEGFASSIRASIRTVRESCYAIIYSMSRFGIHFFGISELPGPLAHALFADALALSSHQMLVLLNVSRYLIEGCPGSERPHFLPPLLASLLTQIDNQMSAEWSEVLKKKSEASLNDNLTEEMKGESIIRQLEHAAVCMVIDITNPNALSAHNKEPLRDFVLSSDTILEPLVFFCNHALIWQDTRCSSKIIRVCLGMIPMLALSNRPEIQEYICHDMLKTAIMGLNDDYFVDIQRDFATLIGSIIVNYAHITQTVQMVLASLPGLEEQEIARTIQTIQNEGQNGVAASPTKTSKSPGSPTTSSGTRARTGATEVLHLLGDLRGVSLAEKGKLDPLAATRKAQLQASRARRERRERQAAGAGQDGNNNGDVNTSGVPKKYLEQPERNSPDLGGVADMFG